MRLIDADGLKNDVNIPDNEIDSYAKENVLVPKFWKQMANYMKAARDGFIMDIDETPTVDPELLPIVQELREKLARYEQDCGRATRVCEVFFRKPNTVEKALFHCWTDKSQVVEPSMMRGGHNGGIIMCTYGIVEFKNGRVCEVLPSQIRFLDTKVCMDKAEWENTNQNQQG